MPCPGEDEFYLFLFSKGSRQYFPLNSPNDFSIKLAEMYHLQGCWQVALTELYHQDIPSDSTVFSVLSDICEESNTDSTKLPILRKIHKENSFSQCYYVPVRNKVLHSIRIYINTETGQRASLKADTLHCVLHLRRKDV